MSIWCFKQFPTVIFCSNQKDPCTCTGGGFEIYDKFCLKPATNLTSVNVSGLGEAAKEEYQSIFDALAGDAGTVLLGITTVFVVTSVFA